MKTFMARPHQLLLRDLFCLILVAVVGVAFWREHQKTSQHAATLAIEVVRSQLKSQRLEAELQATRRELAEIQSELAEHEPPILKRVEELKRIAFESEHGHLGCGDGTITIVNSQGERVTTRCSLDPLHVFGKQVDISDVLTLLQSRIKSNKSGKSGPMSSGTRSLCYICFDTLIASQDPAAVPVIKECMLTERTPHMRRCAAEALWRMAANDSLRPEIERIQFPSDVKFNSTPPDWVCFQ